jgi:hypothetical protein
MTLAILIMLLKSVSNTVRSTDGRSNTDVPGEITLFSPFHISEEDVARYQCAVGLTESHISEICLITLPLFLSAVTEPAILLLLTSSQCLINPIRAVNVRSRFEVLRPDLCHLKKPQ